MTDLTEREKQIVAWLRLEMAEYLGTEYRRHLEIVLTAIEAGEPWKDSRP